MTKRPVEVVCGCVREGDGGGGLPPPSDNGARHMGYGGGASTEGPASQKALPLLIKRPSFLT